MAYMTRLGLWGVGTPFPACGDFITRVERAGVSGMELVAMELKAPSKCLLIALIE